jgi:hypothetical protein
MAGLSQIEIANSALRQLGSLPIHSFADETETSDAARDEYPKARDATLEAHPWNFATFYRTLARLADPPAWGWTYAYSLQTEPYLLRVLQMENNASFEIGADQWNGRVLFTNEATANVRSIHRIDDLGRWNALAVEACIKYLAALLAPMLTGQQTRKAALLEEFQKMLGSGMDRDAHEGTPHVVPPNRTLVNIRHRSS